jgi:SAM-dependent methyltransferase
MGEAVMEAVVNAHQAQAWNGYEGQHWADHHDRYDAVNSGFNEPLLAAAQIRDGDRVLDIGCGNGQVTRLAARLAKTGRVTGIDLSAPMLGRARELAEAEGIDNLDLIHSDAQTYPFGDEALDVAISRFGIMFFADPAAAFANVRRALRPDGRFAFLCLQGMDRNEFGPVFAAALDELPPPDTAPSDDPGPMSFAEPDAVTSLLATAGFREVAVGSVRASQLWGRDAEDAADFLYGWGLVRFQVAQAPAAAAERVRAAAVTALRPYEAPDGVRLLGAAWLVTAVR